MRIDSQIAQCSLAKRISFYAFDSKAIVNRKRIRVLSPKCVQWLNFSQKKLSLEVSSRAARVVHCFSFTSSGESELRIRIAKEQMMNWRLEERLILNFIQTHRNLLDAGELLSLKTLAYNVNHTKWPFSVWTGLFLRPTATWAPGLSHILRRSLRIENLHIRIWWSDALWTDLELLNPRSITLNLPSIHLFKSYSNLLDALQTF